MFCGFLLGLWHVCVNCYTCWVYRIWTLIEFISKGVSLWKEGHFCLGQFILNFELQETQYSCLFVRNSNSFCFYFVVCSFGTVPIWGIPNRWSLFLLSSPMTLCSSRWCQALWQLPHCACPAVCNACHRPVGALAAKRVHENTRPLSVFRSVFLFLSAETHSLLCPRGQDSSEACMCLQEFYNADIIYSAFGNYSDLFTFSTFCYITASS